MRDGKAAGSVRLTSAVKQTDQILFSTSKVSIPKVAEHDQIAVQQGFDKIRLWCDQLVPSGPDWRRPGGDGCRSLTG